MSLVAREEDLRRWLEEPVRLAVAFSGGVDSSLLLAVAQEVRGENLLAVTGVSPSLSAEQLAQARRVAQTLGVRHRELATSELDDPDYRANGRDRCFFCKHELYGHMRAILADDRLVIVDGTNADDLGDHRPGREAARRAGVRSPLAEAGLTKAEIRELSRRRGLETADLPASPCLASRLPYGTEVTASRLAAVERGEAALRRAGLREFRLRYYGDAARLELAGDELSGLGLEGRQALVDVVLAEGDFQRLEVDPRPFVSGRLNRG